MTPEPFEVSVASGAVKADAAFAFQVQVRIWDAMDELAANPRHSGCVQLKGTTAWRKRVGDYRILYEIADRVRVVAVVSVGHRSKTYRRR